VLVHLGREGGREGGGEGGWGVIVWCAWRKGGREEEEEE